MSQPTQPKAAHYSRILVAVDDEEYLPVCRRAEQLATQYDADVMLIHVMEPFSPVVAPGVMGGASIIPDTEAENYDEALKLARRKLTDIAAAMPIEKVETKVVEDGDIARAIHSEAEAHGSDLVVVGSHGRHGLALLFSGSTAVDLLKKSPCDVLAVTL